MTAQYTLPAIVAIGSSAGGFDALNNLLPHLPPQAAYIILQHMDPEKETHLAAHLKQIASLPLHEVTSGELLHEGNIYFVPPGRDAMFDQGRISLCPLSSESHPAPSIDRFFTSLVPAATSVIAILLSGMGHDGTEGMRAVKIAGGITLVQLPKEAKFPEMPSEALRQGVADRSLSLAQMPEIIAGIHNHSAAFMSATPEPSGYPRLLEQVITLMRYHTESDFSQYKRKTIERRLTRRITLLHLSSIEEYLVYVKEHPEDLGELAKDVLISVTAFFRDAEAFDFLKETLAATLKTKSIHDPIRIWIPACSTGEEAYSMAILLAELLEEDFYIRKIQIFATDMDDRSINHARRGVYSTNAVTHLSEEILTRYFQKERHSFEIIKPIRERIVFARQDLVKDPPFSHLDCISCRNLLIYHQPDLQSRIIHMFHYALAPGGILFLGKSESLGSSDNLFSPLSTKWRVFSKRNDVTPRPF
ncbi:hypothetical protein KJ865_10685, partial [Myxococcota bacterium]|nr:hypothetical protein [Myxococcota bacterium]